MAWREMKPSAPPKAAAKTDLAFEVTKSGIIVPNMDIKEIIRMKERLAKSNARFRR